MDLASQIIGGSTAAVDISVALESRLLDKLGEEALASLGREAEAELAEPGRWGTTFTLIQSWGVDGGDGRLETPHGLRSQAPT